MEIHVRDVYGRMDIVKSLSPKAEAVIEQLDALQVKDETIKEVKQDVNDVGEILSLSLEDSLMLAETLSFTLETVEVLLAEVESLKAEIQTLKGSEA